MAANPKFGVGQAVRRKEDDPLLRGAGHYVADYQPGSTLHAVVVRSPHAHAKFTIADLARVRALPGVRLVLTAPDVADLGPLPTPGVLPDVDIPIPTYPILAGTDVRYVGDAIAFVVADTLAQAKDAAEAISIDWQPLPHVVGAEVALERGAAPVWPVRPGYLAFQTTIGHQKATAEIFAKAARLRFRPILMTSLAFIFGVTPLVWAIGAGAELRQTLGTAVFSGMIGVTAFGLIFTPVFYVVCRWIAIRSGGRRAAAPRSAK
jgi:carbon-monoxide dehydrogenase large subunit